MKIGKLSDEELKRYIFKHISNNRKEVLNGAEIGMDTAVLDLDGDIAVLSTDPITGASDGIGKLSVNVSCNDVASEGAEPVGILLSVLVPPSCELEDLEKIIIEANDECQKIGLDIIGGHTEVTDAVNKIIITSTVIGKIKRDSIVNPKLVKNNDIICISKDIALEGTVIIASEKNDITLSNKELEEIKELSQQISIVDEALLAKKFNVKFMHDITEGGIYGALWESSEFLHKKFVVEKELIPIRDISKKICNYYDIDPYRLISSGSIVMIFDEDDFFEYKLECEKKNIKITKIGYISSGKNVEVIHDSLDNVEEIKNTTTDELYKVV